MNTNEREYSFTDEDLKRIREEIFDRDNFSFDEMILPDQMKALLARLEAAEIVADKMANGVDDLRDDEIEAIEAWRKVSGK